MASASAGEVTKPADHALVLRKFYSELSSTIDAQTVACYMFQHKELLKRDLESIQSKRSEPIRSAEQLLNIVMEQPRTVYWCFLDALTKAEQDDLRKMILFESPENIRELFSHKKIIQRLYTFLVNNLVAKDSELVGELYQAGVLNAAEMEFIGAEVTSSEQNKKLLSVLDRKTKARFDKFLDALDKTGQQHVRNKISGEVKYEGSTMPESSVDENDSPTFSLNVPIIPYSELTKLKKIAAGGFGVVYSAQHPTWETVAYKQLTAPFISDGSPAYDELIHEAMSHKLNHPNIVKLYAVVFEDEHYGVVLEYVPHKDIKDFVHRNKPVDLSKKLCLAHGVVRGMEYLHSVQPHPVVHGDLKAQNVLVGDGLIAKICDFGLSKWKDYSKTQTSSRSKRGTVSHIPPEIWSDINLRRTIKFDVYSFGVLFWELITEEQAFKHVAAEAEIKLAVTSGQRPELNAVTGPESLVKHITDCISRCWDQSPDNRPSFADLKKEVMKIQENLDRKSE